MTLFEYLTVAVSIVLSMGIVRLVGGLLPAMRRDARNWIHVSWILIKIYSHVQYWWLTWVYRQGVDWNFLSFLYLLVGPILLYMQAAILIPSSPEDVASWRERFFGLHRPFFFLNALYVLQVQLGTFVIGGTSPPLAAVIGSGLGVALSLTGAFTSDRRAHAWVVLGSLALIAVTAIGLIFRPLA